MTKDTLRAERWLHFSFALPTLVTGLVDAARYLSMGHIFTANMTGNIVLPGLAVANVPGLSALRSITSLIFAFTGGIVSGRHGHGTANWRRSHWLGLVAGMETTLLFVACMLLVMQHDSVVLPNSSLYRIIALTALAVGIRNGTVRRLGVPDITTTVLTLTQAALASESF